MLHAPLFIWINLRATEKQIHVIFAQIISPNYDNFGTRNYRYITLFQNDHNMKNFLPLLLLTFLISCEDNTMTDRITTLEKELVAAKTELVAAQSNSTYRPGLIHNVFFWLKKDISEADKNSFLEGVNSLKKISMVKSCYIGPPASTEKRDVVDNSFSYALLLHFDDVAGQNTYQVDPIHLKFVEDHKDKWTKVVVYDNLVE
jgi:Stress responsive A/B Barrel Domain